MAGVAIGLLAILGGCVLGYLVANGVMESGGDLPFWDRPGWCWVAVAGIGLISAMLIVGGLLLICWIWGLSSLSVYVGDYGFAVVRSSGIEIFLWDNIAFVRETHIFERPPIFHWPLVLLLPRFMSKTFLIHRRDGKEFVLDGNTARGHEKLATMIQEETEPRGVPWQIVEMSD